MHKELMVKASEYIANTYSRYPIVATKGEGCWLWDIDGRRYLDFLAGIAVCNLGHARKEVVEGLAIQAMKLFHTSNLFYTEPQIKAAKLLVENSFGDKVFFCNSGAEANEAAIKLARRYSWKKYGEGRYEIIVMENSFHGRTMCSLSATGQTKFHEGFSPMLPGFIHVPFNSIEAVEQALGDKTCAVMLEPIQAEGGVYSANKEYISALRQLTKEKDILMILDEVQTGMGRTGKFFGYEHYGIEPDIMSLAKALGNGFPVGAITAKNEVMNAFEPGTHASTFGGNPLACAAVTATINTLIDEGVIRNCEEMGRYLCEGLISLKTKFQFIKEIRGMGLILGVELDINGDAVQKEFMKEGIILNCTKGKILRLVPPLIVKKEDIDLFLETADRIFSKQLRVDKDRE
ncbi:MAG: aspartate aminotransferase family protein [Syntrophobacterales bacterium]|jgi:predicted acetylornithine/succinylornithine family transaminase|nr:aspartate aminotransferase family protein [Syntrophobacterales bacterium]